MKIEFPAGDQIPELKALWAKCFADTPEAIDNFFDTAFSPSRCRCIREGKAIAALYWLDAEYKGQTLAYLYAIATDPQYRGRGLCRALVEDAHTLLKEQGYAAALLMPGEPGLRQMYEKFGYRDCCEISERLCEASGNTALEAVSREAFEALRTQFLPEDGAVQTGIRYLSTYAQFYRGEDFLLAAVREGQTLLGLELLGNSDAAPAVLTALNCQRGTFRTPGKGRQTVMAAPLKEGARLPGYFGLTFD